MKINEKNLSAYATSATPADKEGYLIKRGEVNKGYQKRWFVLKGNLLFYFEKRGDKEPLGVIILEGCTIELDENDAQYSFKIVFHGPGNRSYVLCAESQESMEHWMKILACSSYDYMKLMVYELQRQLQEIEANSCNNSPKSDENTSPNSINDENTKEEEDTNCNSSSSPLPPPRSKANPFNKQARNAPTSSRNRIVFRELHTLYGRPILRDRSEWRHNLKEAYEQLLISL